jgi:hypothetical protein
VTGRRKEDTPVYAILRINSYEPGALAAGTDRMAEFDRLHAAQPGFIGSAVVDLGGGRRFVLNLWDSVEASRAGLRVLAPEVERLLVPLMSAPSQFLGAGPILSWPTARSDDG